jgi:hypothetical protein
MPKIIAAIQRAQATQEKEVEIHVAAPSFVASPMIYKNATIYMGTGLFAPEYGLQVTDPQRLRAFLSCTEYCKSNHLQPE